MPSKLQTYMQMADEAQRQITGSYRGWTAFLKTAARLYKYPYHEQIMIYAQRPDATAGNVEVASYSLGSATAWSGQGISWYNLNTSHYYYFKIVKSTGSARLVFTLDCVAQDW